MFSSFFSGKRKENAFEVSFSNALDKFGAENRYLLGTSSSPIIQVRGDKFVLRDRQVVEWIRSVGKVSQFLVWESIRIVSTGSGKDPALFEVLMVSIPGPVALMRQNISTFCNTIWKDKEQAVLIGGFISKLTMAHLSNGIRELSEPLLKGSDLIGEALHNSRPSQHAEIILDYMKELAAELGVDFARNYPLAGILSGLSLLQSVHSSTLGYSVDSDGALLSIDLYPHYDRLLVKGS